MNYKLKNYISITKGFTPLLIDSISLLSIIVFIFKIRLIILE
jgi:hypothetical protein